MTARPKSAAVIARLDAEHYQDSRSLRFVHRDNMNVEGYGDHLDQAEDV